MKRKNSYYFFYLLINIIMLALCFGEKCVYEKFLDTSYYHSMYSVMSQGISFILAHSIKTDNSELFVKVIFVINLFVAIITVYAKKNNMPIWYRIVNSFIIIFAVLGIVDYHKQFQDIIFEYGGYGLIGYTVEQRLIFYIIVVLDLLTIFGDLIYEKLNLKSFLSFIDDIGNNNSKQEIVGEADELQKYFQLYKDGAITEEEYNKIKNDKLNKERKENEENN